MKRRFSLLLCLFLTLFVVFSGCSGEQAAMVQNESPQNEPESSSQPQTSPAAQDDLAAAAPSTPAPIGSGTIQNAELSELPAEAAALLEQFFGSYYEALARLDENESFSGLFEKEADAAAAQAVLAYACGIRELQAADLSLTSYHYTLHCRRMDPTEEDEKGEDGISLLILEDGVQNFAAYPGGGF